MNVLVEYTDEEPHQLLILKNEQCGILSKSPKSEPSRAGSAADRLVKEAKNKAKLSNVPHFKYLGVLQSSDGDPFVAMNHRIAIA